MKAFLVKDLPSPTCDHEPYLVISGAARVIQGSACKRIMPALLDCDLTGLDVSLATENGNVALPFSPLPNEHLPRSVAEGGSTKWLVRMADVDKGSAKVKADLTGLFDSEFDFGWKAASTCIFDEEEPPLSNKKVVAINFKNQTGTVLRTQAVAERVMFTSSVSSDRPSLILKRRSDAAVVEEIELDCSVACPVLKLSNNVEQDTCTVPSHFDHYLSFSVSPGSKVRVERFSGETIDSISVTQKCIGDNAPTGDMNDTAKAVLMSQGIDILTQPKPSDSLICPPVVMEQ